MIFRAALSPLFFAGTVALAALLNGSCLTGKRTPPCFRDQIAITYRNPLLANVGQTFSLDARATYTTEDCVESDAPVNVEAGPDVALDLTPERALVTPKGAGRHTIQLSSSFGRIVAEAVVDLLVFDTLRIQSSFTAQSEAVSSGDRSLFGPISEFSGCYRESVATSHYVACTAAGTFVFSPDLSRPLTEKRLYPWAWGIGGEGPLLGRASVFEDGLKVDEIGTDGTFLHTATYQPPPNPIKEILDNPKCLKECSPYPSNKANNVAVRGDLVAMTDLVGGLYLLRYSDGTLTELWKNYDNVDPSITASGYGPIPVLLSRDHLLTLHREKFVAYDVSDPIQARLLAKGRLPDQATSTIFNSGRFWLIRKGLLEVHALEGDKLVKQAEYNVGTEVLLASVRGARAVLLDRESIFEIDYKEGAGLGLTRKIPHFGLPAATAAIAPDGSVYVGGPDFVMRYR